VIKGIGIDCVEIERFRRLLDKQPFLKQVCTHAEILRVPAGQEAIDGYVSALFAIKEAVFKALGCGLHDGSHWHSVHVTQNFGIRLAGVLQRYAVEQTVRKVHASVSRSENYVVAMVVLEG